MNDSRPGLELVSALVLGAFALFTFVLGWWALLDMITLTDDGRYNPFIRFPIRCQISRLAGLHLLG